MKLHAKVALIICVVGFVGLIIWRFVEPMLAESRQAEISDMGEKGLLHIGVDGWVGYFPLCSPEMKRRLNQQGYGLHCTDDAADYRDRFKKLKNNEYQFVVATVDSYLLNAHRYKYPGAIVAVIDESKGGDALVAWKNKIPNLEALKQSTEVKIGFTPNSPSHHLIKAVASHFDVPALRSSSNLVEADGSNAVLQLFKKKQIDVAVLWEPDVSRALTLDGVTRLLGTEDTQQLIVDILIGSPQTVKDQPQVVETLLRAYFRTLKFYRDNPEELTEDIRRHYDLDEQVARSLIKGVEMATLSDNAERWYGVNNPNATEQALVDTLEGAASILRQNGDFDTSPIPNQDPYRLLNSSFIKKLYASMGVVGGFTNHAGSSSHSFKPLTDQQWAALKEVGSLKARKITFASGAAELTSSGKQQIDLLMDDLKHYPHFRIEIRGHTGLRGDARANLELSQKRADAVLDYMLLTHAIDRNRVRAIGFGSTKPLPKLPGESSRAYGYRLPRVEIVLVREEI